MSALAWLVIAGLSSGFGTGVLVGYIIGIRSMTRHLRASNDLNHRMMAHLRELHAQQDVLQNDADWWKGGKSESD